MNQSIFGQVRDVLRNAVSNRSEDHNEHQHGHSNNHKSHNGEFDISGAILKGVMSDVSPQEQQQLKQFENSLNQNYDSKQSASSHTPAGQMEIAENMLSHMEQNAALDERAKLHELAEDLESKS
ncbi:hypothetical protein FZC66_15745 [Priestia megaterium]|nr:hypothetical protein FZC66_15745 [Priestia megaterium]